MLRLVFRRELRARLEETIDAEPLGHDGKLVLVGLGIIVAVLLTASAFDKDLGLPTCVAAVAITCLVSIRARSNPLKLAKEISWGTLALVAGLFIMVDAVESIGALDLTLAGLHWVRELAAAQGAIVASLAVGVANNLVNNLPLGLIAGATLRAAHVKGMIANAVLIGVDLGPNLSVTGSLATILWLIALRRERVSVSFWDFLKVGLVAMPATLLVSVGGMILVEMLVKAL